MDDGIPGVKEARYRLLGLQAVPLDDGVVVRRGTTRILVHGERAGELLDLLVARSAEGNGISLDELKAEVDPSRHDVLTGLIGRLTAERLLVRFGAAGPASGEAPEDVFYWNHGTTLAATAASLDRVNLVVFGVNHIALPLLGNLRSCGFRSLTLVDHPALRNLDFFNEGRDLRPEIAAAMSVKPRRFEEWQAETRRPSDCQVVCSDFGGLALMRDWNRACVAVNVLFYPIVLQDEVASLGPLVVPREGPCFECLWARRNANHTDPDVERATEAHAFFGRIASGYLQPMARVAADIGAIELLKFFSNTLPGGSAGRLIEADLMAPALRTRNVLKVPRCPVCSETLLSSESSEPEDAEEPEAAVELAQEAPEAD
jgi:molybdopterin-synthase adenylyltransferase